MAKSFVEIVQEMLEEGIGFNEAVKNLVTIGLNKLDAEKLVSVLSEKASKNFSRNINQLVGKKIISLKEAKKIEKKRKILTRRTRLQHNLNSVKKEITGLLEEIEPGKIPVFNSRFTELLNAIESEEKAKRGLRAFLSDFEKKNIKGRDKRKIRGAKELFNPFNPLI